MAIDYKSYDFQVYEYLVRLMQELEAGVRCPETAAWMDQIREAQERIKTRHFRVAVVGEFKKGKSSFINALLGKEIVPVDASPATATINRITYGAVPKAHLIYKDGSIQDVEIDALAAYVTKLTGESEENAARIREAVVEYPSVFCQNYVDLIDTPGMNDDESMNQLTLSKLNQIDLAIVAVSANQPFSETECKFVVKLLENPEICQIIVVVTYIDTVREKDRERLLAYIKERVRDKVKEKLEGSYEPDAPIFQKYEQIFGQLKQFAISSVDALDAREQGDMELLEGSGIVLLNRELPQLILGSQNNNALQKAMASVEGICGQYEEFAPGLRERYLKEKERIGEVQKEFADIAGRAPDRILEEAGVKLRGLLDDFGENARNTVRGDFIRCLSAIRELDADVLEEALDRQSIDTFRQLRRDIAETLSPNLEKSCGEQLDQSMEEIRLELRGKLAGFAGYFEQAQEALAAVFGGWWRDAAKEKEPEFGWMRSLVPAKQKLLEIDIIDWVNASAAESISGYCSRREEGLVERLQAIRKRFAEALNGLAADVHRCGETCLAEWEACLQAAEGGGSLERVRQVRRENAQLEAAFIRELAQEQQA